MLFQSLLIFHRSQNRSSSVKFSIFNHWLMSGGSLSPDVSLITTSIFGAWEAMLQVSVNFTKGLAKKKQQSLTSLPLQQPAIDPKPASPLNMRLRSQTWHSCRSLTLLIKPCSTSYSLTSKRAHVAYVTCCTVPSLYTWTRPLQQRRDGEKCLHSHWSSWQEPHELLKLSHSTQRPWNWCYFAYITYFEPNSKPQ